MTSEYLRARERNPKAVVLDYPILFWQIQLTFPHGALVVCCVVCARSKILILSPNSVNRKQRDSDQAMDISTQSTTLPQGHWRDECMIVFSVQISTIEDCILRIWTLQKQRLANSKAAVCLCLCTIMHIYLTVPENTRWPLVRPHKQGRGA